MVWMLEGSGCEAHHSLWYSFCVSCTRTHTHTHAPSLSLIHSLTLGDALLHSSLPGAVKKARETHKSKLKCSSECFLDMMHGSWDAAWPRCYTCKCAETHRPWIQNTTVVTAKQKSLSLAFHWPSSLHKRVWFRYLIDVKAWHCYGKACARILLNNLTLCN